jgi:hypothetical protein
MEVEKTREELGFLDWARKVNERCTLIQMNLIDKKDLTEDDYFLLEVIHRIWWMGELPFYQDKLDLKEEKAGQTGLFATESSISAHGTDVDISR